MRLASGFTVDDWAAIAVVAGCIGGCVLLGLAVGAVAGLGLFFALLAGWGVVTLRAVREGGDLAAHGDGLEPQQR